MSTHEVESLKLRCQRNVEKERNAAAEVIKHSDTVVAYYHHVNGNIANLFTWIREDLSKLANDIQTPEGKRAEELVKEGLSLLEKQLEVLSGHNFANELDIKDLFNHYAGLLREQFVAVVGLDRAQLNNAAMAWKQDVIQVSQYLPVRLHSRCFSAGFDHEARKPVGIRFLRLLSILLLIVFLQTLSVAGNLAVQSHTGNLNMQILDLTNKLFATQMQLQNANANIDNVKRELFQTTTLLSVDEKKLLAAEEQLRKALENSLKVSARATETEGKNQELKDALEKSKYENDLLQAKLDSSKNDSDRLQAELYAAQEKVKQLVAKLHGMEENVAGIQSTMEERENTIKSLENRIDSLQSDKVASELAFVKIDKLTGELRTNIEEQKTKMVGMEQKLRGAETSIDQRDKAIRGLKQRIDSLEIDKVASELAMADKDRITDDLQKELATIETKIQGKIDKRDQTIKELKEKHVSLEQAVAQKDKEIGLLKAKLSGKINYQDEVYQSLRNQYVAARRECMAKEDEFEKLKKEFDDVKATLPTDPASDHCRMLNMKKRIDELINENKGLYHGMDQYQVLLQAKVSSLKDERINFTLFEAGLHRDAPKHEYVRKRN